MDNLIEQINSILTKDTNVNIITDILKNYNNYDWKKYIVETSYYTKILIYRNSIYEIFLISWNKDISTPFHNHPRNGCILKVLEGTLIESMLDGDEFKILNIDDISCINHNIYHKITSIGKSYSIHVYSPPLFYEKNENIT